MARTNAEPVWQHGPGGRGRSRGLPGRAPALRLARPRDPGRDGTGFAGGALRRGRADPGRVRHPERRGVRRTGGAGPPLARRRHPRRRARRGDGPRGHLRVLPENVSSAGRRASAAPTYSLVDDLIVSPPLVVQADTPLGEVARRMTDADVPCAVVQYAPGGFGLITDSLLRIHVLVEGRPLNTEAHEVMDTSVPVALLGDSAAEALLQLLDRNAEFVLVTDRAGALRGVVAPRDFAVSPTTAGVSLHEQLRRTTCVDDLACHAAGIPAMLSDLLARGLASGRVITVYSAVVDTLVRR